MGGDSRTMVFSGLLNIFTGLNQLVITNCPQPVADLGSKPVADQWATIGTNWSDRKDLS